ncbi:MAG: neutral/alkaline non-lysosomal ceramidase N-terminal domain-containing protein, partial [Candidatus Glassbacteria bacterium]|nr:neutral/alkaline non-lysosomal ceramidase N-terminal domain-containing protein [Candidatus Glassbacteria bacterium]
MKQKISRRSFVGLTGAGLATLSAPRRVPGQSGGSLRGGTARVDITPPVGCWLSGWEIRDKPSEGVADNLYAKALVLADGENRIALVSADLIGVPAGIVSAAREAARRQTGIPGENILIAATHTHFGPMVKKYRFEPGSRVDPAYLEELTGKLARVVKEAHGRLAGIRVGAAKGEAPELLFNRRTRDSRGRAVMTFVLPPADPGLSFGP